MVFLGKSVQIDFKNRTAAYNTLSTVQCLAIEFASMARYSPTSHKASIKCVWGLKQMMHVFALKKLTEKMEFVIEYTSQQLLSNF